MNIKMLMSVVLKSLGITAFTKDDSGKLSLSADQKTKLSEIFGKEFAEKFAVALADEKEEGAAAASTTTTEDEEKPDAKTEGLINALRAHHASTVEAGLKDLQAKLAAEQQKTATLQETVNALSGSAEELPGAKGPEFKGADGKVVVMKVDKAHAHYQGVNEFLQTGSYANISAATIEVGDLKTEFGKFLSQNGNNLDIIVQIFKGFTSAKYFTTKMATTEWRAVQALVTSVSQQFSSKWNPGGKTKFTPLKIINRRHKINYPIIPADVLDSYMFLLYDEKMSPDQMPITKYIWDTLIYPALMQDIEMRMIWKGKFVDHQATNDEGDVATPPEDSMDGIETILVDQKALGAASKVHFYNKYPAFDWNTATDQEILDFVNGFVDWLSPFYKTTKMPLFIADDNKRKYKRAYKKVWGTNSGQDGDFGNDRVDYSNQMLEAPDGMFGSPIIFSTPLQNMIMLRHKNEAPRVINDVQKHNYEVRLFGEYWLGAGFAIAEAIFAYVPAAYNPKALISDSLGDFDDYQSFKTDDFASDGGGI